MTIRTPRTRTTPRTSPAGRPARWRHPPHQVGRTPDHGHRGHGAQQPSRPQVAGVATAGAGITWGIDPHGPALSRALREPERIGRPDDGQSALSRPRLHPRRGQTASARRRRRTGEPGSPADWSPRARRRGSPRRPRLRARPGRGRRGSAPGRSRSRIESQAPPGHQPSRMVSKAASERRLQGEVVESPPPEHRHLPVGLGVALDLEHVELRRRARS